MALFGTQLIITMIAACVLQKLGPFYSLARWILCSSGLKRYRYPTDATLKEAAGIVKNGKKKGKHDDSKEGFLVPKNAEFELETSPVEHFEVSVFNFYTEYQWLVDFAVCTVFVYGITEAYTSLLPLRDEVNLSMLWCLMVVGFTARLLCRLTAVFVRSSAAGSGELEICAVSGLAYCVVSMVILVTSDELLELQLEQAYGSFNQSATHFLQAHGLGSSGPASMFAFRLLLAVLSGFAGAILMFPGLRYTRMHRDCLRMSGDNRPLQVLYHLNFVMPLINVLTWVKPLSRDYLTDRVIPSTGAPLLSNAAFDSLRLWLLIVTVVLRLVLMPRHLQAYLNMSRDKLDKIRSEAGRIRSTELQKKIVSVYYYVCVAALQFVAPLILSLYLTLMYKTLGGLSWVGAESAAPAAAETSPLPAPPTADELGSATQHVTFTLAAVKRVFTPGFYRGLLGYLTWWTSFIMFTSSVVGSSLLGYT